MKKHKDFVPFCFKDKTHDEVCKLIEEKFPIKLRKQKNLLQRVKERLPFIAPHKIDLVTLSFFNVFRNQLISGNAITLQDICYKSQILMFATKYFGLLDKKCVVLKVIGSLPDDDKIKSEAEIAKNKL